MRLGVWAARTRFLGHRLSHEGVSVDPRKVQSIVEWATSTSCSEVRRFTGLANYQDECQCRRHPVAYESRKLMAAERNYPAHVFELLALVNSLRVFRHYLLGSGAPRQDGCWSDFNLRTDNQAITWLKTNRHLNKMYVRWLDEIEDFRFDMTHLPGAHNPIDQLSRCSFADGNEPAASFGDPDTESQQELFSPLGSDAPVSARLAGTTLAPSPPTPSDDLFLAPAFVQTLAAELAVDTLFGPILREAAAALSKLVDRLGTPIID